MDLLKSILGDVNPKELFETMVAFMHQTVAHQRTMEAGIKDIQERLNKVEEILLEDARLLDDSHIN